MKHNRLIFYSLTPVTSKILRELKFKHPNRKIPFIFIVFNNIVMNKEILFKLPLNTKRKNQRPR